MKVLRKLKTFSAIIAGCANWPEIALVKLGLSKKAVKEIRLRNGLTIELDRGVRADWGEVFEPAIADVYGTVNSDADLFVDVGANLGSFSCLAAYTHPSARVYAFEPAEDAAAQALRNFTRNNLGRVILIKAPVTGDGREVRFATRENRGAANIFMSSEHELCLASTTLDCVDFSKAKSLFVKLDCEGAEGEIIDWLIDHRDSLPGRVRIACEYHPWCPIPLPVTAKRLQAAGFRPIERTLFDEQYLFAESA